MIELNFIDGMGHVGYLYIALGMGLLSNRLKSGWVFRFIGEAIWVGLGITLGLSSIWIWGTIFCVIDIRGYLKWRELEHSQQRLKEESTSSTFGIGC